MKLYESAHCFNLRSPTTEALIPNPCGLGDLPRDAGLPCIVRELAPNGFIATRTSGKQNTSWKMHIRRLEEFSFNDEAIGFLNCRSLIARHDRAIAVISDRIKTIA